MEGRRRRPCERHVAAQRPMVVDEASRELREIHRAALLGGIVAHERQRGLDHDRAEPQRGQRRTMLAPSNPQAQTHVPEAKTLPYTSRSLSSKLSLARWPRIIVVGAPAVTLGRLRPSTRPGVHQTLGVDLPALLLDASSHDLRQPVGQRPLQPESLGRGCSSDRQLRRQLDPLQRDIRPDVLDADRPVEVRGLEPAVAIQVLGHDA